MRGRAEQKTAPESRAGDRGQTARWSNEVTRKSDALDLESGVFTWDDPERIALSLKRSAEESRRRKAAPYQSAMSMLNFYINRAGRNLDADQRQVLERVKEELRKAFGRAESGAAARPEGRRD
jgi:Protein of unknown function (DUF3175)